MEITLPIMRGDNIADNADYRDSLPVNYTVIMKPVRGANGYLRTHPGIRSFATGLGKDRAGYWNERQSRLFRVSGQNLIQVEDNGTIVDLGAVTGTDRASMAHSFDSQSIVADGKWWLYDGTSLTQQTDTNLGTPIDHTWIDGFYFFTDGESLYHTSALDETQIDPLDFATSEFSPDPTLAVDRTSDNLVIVFNRYTTEWFRNVATDNFAFQRLQNKAIKCGVVGTHAETEMESQFYVLGGGREEDISVHILAGGAYQSIASKEVDEIIGSYTETELKDAVLETRVEGRESRFVMVRLPNHTLLYNKAVAEKLGADQAWTIVKSQIETDGAWRGVNGALKPDVGWLYGDTTTTDIGVLDFTIATQYDEPVETILYTPLVDLETMSIDEIELDTIPGHQLSSDDVTCAISATTDGVTFGTEYWELYGEQYNYKTRFIMRRGGYVDNFIGYKIRYVGVERLAFSLFKAKYG